MKGYWRHMILMTLKEEKNSKSAKGIGPAMMVCAANFAVGMKEGPLEARRHEGHFCARATQTTRKENSNKNRLK